MNNDCKKEWTRKFVVNTFNKTWVSKDWKDMNAKVAVDKEKALFTVSAIKKRPIKYQVNVIATMLGRAKNHPNKTKDMNDAIIIFNKWMENYKANKK